MFQKLIYFIILYSAMGFAQTSYEGTLGEMPIELVLNIDSEYADGIYIYTKYNQPIAIKGTLNKNKLNLLESEHGKDSGQFLFTNFKKNQPYYSGTWTNLKTKTTYPFVLNKKKYQNNLLQAESSQKYFYRVGIEGEINFVYAYEKKSGKLFTKTVVECDGRGIYDISVEDYNFDGKEDFSACIQSYAGPNTSKTYYLFDVKKNKFVESDFSGTSLEFDILNKKIYETNQCCAGSSIMKNVYVVKNNKMILKEEHCFKLDQKTNELVEKKPKDCY